MPMLSASFTIAINMFRPLGGVFPISASITPAPGNPKCVTISGKNIEVCSNAPVQLTFELPNPGPGPGHVLLGVAFAANQVDPTVGMHTFPTILINRQGPANISTMTVTDQPQSVGKQHYGYVILVQSIATGEIGMIDPDITNKPGI